MTTHTSTAVDARFLREIHRYSDRDRGVEKFISKLRNRRTNGKIDLSCISVWDGTGLYYCQQIVACPCSKCLWKQNWFQLIYQNLSWLQYCVLLPYVWLRNILHKWFVTKVLTLPIHVLLQPQNFVRVFCNDSWFRSNALAYFSSFSRRSNISIRKTLQKFANHIYSVKMI